MKKIFRYLVLLASLSLHAAAWGDMADNGVECSVVMEKTRFDARETFPDFKLVFTNKGEKTVRLFDDFYPLKDDGPNTVSYTHLDVYKRQPCWRNWNAASPPFSCPSISPTSWSPFPLFRTVSGR